MCLNYLLNINDTVDGFSTSCTADEIDFLYHFAEREGFITKDPQELYNRYKNYLRFFILDEKIIISVMDFPAIQGGPPSSVIIVRNEVGKFIWKAELTLFANHEIETPDSAITVIPPPLTSKPLYDYSYKSPKLPGPLEDSFNWFEEYSLKRKEASVLEEKAKILNANEQNYLQTVSFGLKKDITYQVPRLLDIWGGASKVLHSRILLTHLGFMVPRNIDRISLLESQYQLLNTLKSLDKISEREPVVASVVYFKKNQRTISEIFSQNQDDASLDFKSFVASLGWKVETKDHPHFNGSFDSKYVSVAEFPFYCDATTESAFLISTMMGSTLNHRGRKKLKQRGNSKPKHRTPSKKNLMEHVIISEASSPVAIQEPEVLSTTSSPVPAIIPGPPSELPPPLPGDATSPAPQVSSRVQKKTHNPSRSNMDSLPSTTPLGRKSSVKVRSSFKAKEEAFSGGHHRCE
eukprot:TRINITY_DN6704_c0_g1_i15.p2 TRINITY_DN6704_c0_g1~~TRINITY_DN6704_c0_g1_i15.p2  ORF type:complete len:463 (+),score=125.25 TRINITY_DN6704_c0_g1_i15:2239-3627(+)